MEPREGIERASAHERTQGGAQHSDGEAQTQDPGAHADAGALAIERIANEPDVAPSYAALLSRRFGAIAKGRYGVAPDYRRLVQNKRPQTAQYQAAIAKAAAYVTARAAELVPERDRFEITETELATTFLAEGGDQVLAGTGSESLPPGMASMYNYGNKEYRARLLKTTYYKWLDHCLHPSATAQYAAQYESNGELSLETKIYSVAAGYASFKISAALDHRRLRGSAFRELSPSEQLFWVSIYFASGAPNGAKQMAAHASPRSGDWNTQPAQHDNGAGIKPDTPKNYVGNPYWYALRRVASSEQLDK